MTTESLPDSLKRLTDRFRTEFAAEIDVEFVSDAPRFRIGVTSAQFEGVPHLRRQNLLWKVVDDTCTREDTMMISLILAYAPSELSPTL
jgi:stress-induced morphogen